MQFTATPHALLREIRNTEQHIEGPTMAQREDTYLSNQASPKHIWPRILVTSHKINAPCKTLRKVLSRSSLFSFPQKEGRLRGPLQCCTPPNKIPDQSTGERWAGTREAGGGLTYQPGRGPESGALGPCHWVLRYLPASRELGPEFG